MAEAKSAKIQSRGYAARDNSGHLSPYNFERRAPGPKDVLFDVKYCGICHTDLHQIKNDWFLALYPLVPGHEVVGIVTKVGGEVTKFKVGDRIGVGCFVNSCRTCSSCEEGMENYCLTKLIWTYSETDYDGSITYGGYANNMVVSEDFALKIPKNLPMDKAAPLLCAGITVYSPMKHYEMAKGGKKFGVIGLGGVGHMAVKFAKAFGMHVTVISTSLNKKQEALEELGADSFLVSSDLDAMKKSVRSLDFIIDTVSAAHPLDMYLELLKINGKIIVVGMPPHLQLMPNNLIIARRMVGGSLVGGIAETQEMLDFCSEHNVVCTIETIPMSYVNEAMERMKNSDVHYRFVIDVGNSFKNTA